MIELKNGCLTPEGLVCSGEPSPRRWLCPRAIYCFRRQGWLHRLEPVPSSETPPAAARRARIP
jgi:hypothetical protein